jgi:nicotinamidase-related amidase
MSDEQSDLNLEPRRTAIVVIDLQKGIAGIPGGEPHTKPAVIANCARLLTAARAAGAQPVLVHVGGSPDGADRVHTPTDQAMRSLGALPPDWSELIPELDRQPSDVVILKRQWGAFYGTDLDLQLRVRRREHGARRLRARLRADLRRGRDDRHDCRKPRQQHGAHLPPHGPGALD